MIKLVLNVDSPREVVYQILTDYAAYTSWLPGCRRCTIISSTGNQTDVETVIDGMKTITMQLRFEAELEQSVRFSLIKSKDLKAYSGEYRLMDAASGAGTVIITEIEMDAGAMVPKFMLQRLVHKVLEDTGKALQNRSREFATKAVTAKAPGTSSQKRRRRILKIARTAEGSRIWYLGRMYEAKERG